MLCSYCQVQQIAPSELDAAGLGSFSCVHKHVKLKNNKTIHVLHVNDRGSAATVCEPTRVFSQEGGSADNYMFAEGMVNGGYGYGGPVSTTSANGIVLGGEFSHNSVSPEPPQAITMMTAANTILTTTPPPLVQQPSLTSEQQRRTSQPNNNQVALSTISQASFNLNEFASFTQIVDSPVIKRSKKHGLSCLEAPELSIFYRNKLKLGESQIPVRIQYYLCGVIELLKFQLILLNYESINFSCSPTPLVIHYSFI